MSSYSCWQEARCIEDALDERGDWESLHESTGPLIRCPRCAQNGGTGELGEQGCTAVGLTVACEECSCCLGDAEVCSDCEHRYGGER